MGQGLANDTIRRKLAALSSLYAYLCDRNAVLHNPVLGVKRPRSMNRDGVKFLIFTACKPDQAALEPAPAALKANRGLRPHGLFTAALLEALGHPDEIGKAGRQRWKGRMPHNRGISMNPVDHPHCGRTNGGKQWTSPWGSPPRGKKTRNNKATQKFIIASRHARKKT